MKIKKNGFWDQLYQVGKHEWEIKEITDICTYMRGIVKGLGIIAVTVTLVVLFSIFVTEPYIDLVLYSITGYFGGFWADDIGLFLASSFFQIIILLGFISLLLWKAIGLAWNNFANSIEWGNPSTETKNVNPIKLWYKAVEEKTCFIVERVDPKEANDER